MWDPQHLTILSASTACYGNSFTFYLSDRKLSAPQGHSQCCGVAKIPFPLPEMESRLCSSYHIAILIELNVENQVSIINLCNAKGPEVATETLLYLEANWSHVTQSHGRF
jgi:hypothetical protein